MIRIMPLFLIFTYGSLDNGGQVEAVATRVKTVTWLSNSVAGLSTWHLGYWV